MTAARIFAVVSRPFSKIFIKYRGLPEYSSIVFFFSQILTQKEERKERTLMINKDTIYLLRECNSGTKMAVYSIDEVLEKVKDQKMKDILSASKTKHETIGDKLHIQLQKYGDETKAPSAMAKGMSWMKTNAKLAMEDSDIVCAGLITDGCNMGVKTLYRYLNEYVAAEEEAQDFCRDIIKLEEHLAEEMKAYL